MQSMDTNRMNRRCNQTKKSCMYSHNDLYKSIANMRSNRMKVVNVELPDEVYARLRDEAEREHRSLRAHVRHLLAYWDITNEVRVPQFRRPLDPRSIA